MQGKVILDVTDGALRGKSFELVGPDIFLLGRRSHCHAQLNDACVSRHHLILEVNGPTVALRDLGSLQGTYVNERKYGGRELATAPPSDKSARFPVVDIHDGDRIKVGETVLLVHVVGPPATGFARREELTGKLPAPDGRDIAAELVVHCPKCGADGLGEIALGHDGPYTCTACHEETFPQPVGLRRLVQAARNGSLPHPSSNRFEGYMVESELGRGGMGVVYSARRASDGQRVAIKTMDARVVVLEQARQMFLREMMISQQLQHPNIVRLLEAHSAGTGFYFVMEYCDAGSLAEMAQQCGGKVAASVIAPLLAQCLAALQAAHDAKVIHRDIKPTNILLTGKVPNWTAKIADFGLAKNFDLAGFSGITLTNQAGDTPMFMPREQVTEYKYQRPVSDIWSMEASFYYALTGTSPLNFSKDRDDLEVLLQDEPVLVGARNPNVPTRLAKALDRALSVDPAMRYQSAAAMAAEL